MNIVDSAQGRYEVVGNPADAKVIIGHSFGTSIDEGSPNHALAHFIMERADGRPIVADRTLVNAFPNRDADVAHVVEGAVSGAAGGGVGTLGTLVAGKNFMIESGLEDATTMQVGQAHHIGRIAWQAKEAGLDMNSVVPKGLPDVWDVNSEQRWTQSEGLWVPREVAGFVALQGMRWLRTGPLRGLNLVKPLALVSVDK